MVSHATPQPRGTKNSTQMNRFNKTFERFTETILNQQTPIAAPSTSPEQNEGRHEEDISADSNQVTQSRFSVVI
ncbi:hypothetical protein MBANPS3_010812 [Mucor bainieri]